MKRVTTCYLSISIPANEENNSNLTLNEFLTKVKRNTPIHYFSCHENTPSHTTLEGMSASSWAHESPTQPYNKDLHTENCTYTFADEEGIKEVQNRSSTTSCRSDLLEMMNWTYNISFTWIWTPIILTPFKSPSSYARGWNRKKVLHMKNVS